jgi:hypothetical protein
LSYVGLHADQARITGNHFAELDGHNSLTAPLAPLIEGGMVMAC